MQCFTCADHFSGRKGEPFPQHPAVCQRLLGAVTTRKKAPHRRDLCRVVDCAREAGRPAAQLSAQHRRLLQTPRTLGAHRSPLPFVLHLHLTSTAVAPVHQPHIAAACRAIRSVRVRTGRCNLQDNAPLGKTCQYCPTGTKKDQLEVSLDAHEDDVKMGQGSHP